MKKLLLTLLACFAVVTANAWTVYFTNPDNWTNVYVWAWNDSMEGGPFMGTDWPGQKMTKINDQWTYTGSNTNGAPTKIIFNAGKDQPQTNNLDFEDGATYNMQGVLGAKLNTYTVYFENTNNWKEVYAYSWSPTLAGGYPGTKLSLKSGSSNIYEWNIEITDTTPPDFSGGASNGSSGFQFNDNKSTDGNEKKTPNIYDFQVGATYKPDGSIVGQGPNYSSWWVNIIGEYNWDFPGQHPNADTNIATLTNVPIGTKGFKAKIWDGNNDQYYISNSAIPTGQWVQLTLGDETSPVNTIANATSSSVYNVQYNVESNKIYIELVGGQNPDTYPATMYIGSNDINGTTEWTLAPMTKGENGVYTWKGTSLGSGFKFTDAQDWQGTYNIGASDQGNLEINKPYTFNNDSKSGNIYFAQNATSALNPEVTLNLANGTVTVNGTLVIPVTPPDLYIRASWNDYAADDSSKLTVAEDGVTYSGKFTVSTLTGDNTEYKFKIADASWGTNNFGCNEGETIDVYNNIPGSATLVQNGTDLIISNWTAGEMNITFNLTSKVVTVEGPNQPAYEIAKDQKYYLIGNFNEWDEEDTDYELVLTDGEYFGSFELPGGLVYPEKDGEDNVLAFKVFSGDWTTSFGGIGKDGGDQFLVVEADEPLEVEMVLGVTAKNWVIKNWVEEAAISFAIDPSNLTLIITSSVSGVEGLEKAEMNNGEEVIYNLQGVRVNRDRMGKGIYIINGKKVMVQ